MKKIIPLIFLIILLIITSVFLYVQNQNLKKEMGILNNKIAELEKQKLVTPTPTPIVEKLPIGWKEYTDEEYKFRVWYPEEFTGYGETAKIRIEKLKNDYDIKNNWINEIQIYMPLSSDAPVGLAAIYIYILTLLR